MTSGSSFSLLIVAPPTAVKLVDAERIGNKLDFLVNITATKTPSRRHIHILSIAVAWVIRGSVDAHI